MPFIPFTRGIKVAMEYNLAGQLVVNVYHIQSEDAIITANLEAIAAIFLDFWDTEFTAPMKASFTSDIALERIVVTDVSVADGEQYVEEPGTPIPGTNSGDSVPNNVAWVCSMRSTFTGRSRRGRNYYAGLPETLVVNNIVDAGHVLDMLENIVRLADKLDAEGFPLGVASYYTLGAPRATALFTAFTSFGGDTVVDSQRRRLPGRGA